MKRYLKLILQVSVLLYAMIPLTTQACNTLSSDDPFATGIRKQLNANQASLCYPKSVLRFYKQTDFQPAWIKKQSGMGPAWQAMLMIDCVLQFGLSHDDYHPKDLTYTRLHDILDTPGKVKIQEQARYELLLTDAVLTLINHLHFGKLNPEYPALRIDNGLSGKLDATTFLAAAVDNKNKLDIMEAIANAQPKNELYRAMQYRMHLLKGQYDGDCYDIPEAEVRKIAINMERLRWAALDEETYVQINIPNYTLQFRRPDTTYTFKVIVGKPTNPTPTLSSAISYFTTGPEWKVPHKILVKELLPKALADTAYFANNNYSLYDLKGNFIDISKNSLNMIRSNPTGFAALQSSGCENALGAVVFRFKNIYNVYLHDTPEQCLFKKEYRDFSHGCIRVERAKDLGLMLLNYDHSADHIPAFKKAFITYQRKNFKLKKPVPIHITYLTCEMKEGVMITYKDIYNLDKSLEMALYNANESLVMK